MKRSIASLIVLSIGILTIQSCKKDPSAKETNSELSVLAKIKALDSEYPKKPVNSQKVNTVTLQAAPPDPGKTVISDGIGALGGAILGPVGAICGGIVASISYAFWDVQPMHPTNTTSTNPSNPYDNYGIMHNQTCVYMANNLSLFKINGVFNYDNAIDVSKQYVLANYSQVFQGYNANNSDIKNLVTLIQNQNLSGANAAQILSAMVSAGYITSNEESIMNSYFNTLIGNTDPIGYSIAAEGIINNDNSLTAASKNKILISMAVARNSIVLWVLN